MSTNFADFQRNDLFEQKNLAFKKYYLQRKFIFLQFVEKWSIAEFICIRKWKKVKLSNLNTR